jgi:hypothetical protein
MQQEFKPVAIGGSVQSRASAIAEDIAANDYHVADMQKDKYEPPKVRYKDQNDRASSQRSTWTAANETLQAAITAGRENRLKYGSGLDILQRNLQTGAEPDLIAASKKRMMRVY